MDPARNALGRQHNGVERPSTASALRVVLLTQRMGALRRMQLPQQSRDEFGQRGHEVLAGHAALSRCCD